MIYFESYSDRKDLPHRHHHQHCYYYYYLHHQIFLFRVVYLDILGSQSLYQDKLSRDFIKSLSVCFLFKSISLSNEPTIGFSASKVEMSSKTSSKGFCLLSIYLLIRSNFCLKLASFILSLVTELFISVCILFAKSDVARIYFWTSSFGISASAAIRE